MHAILFTQLGLDAYLKAASDKTGIPMGPTKNIDCIQPQTVTLSATDSNLILTGDVKWLAGFVEQCDGTMIDDTAVTFPRDDPQFVKESLMAMTSTFGYELTVDSNVMTESIMQAMSNSEQHDDSDP